MGRDLPLEIDWSNRYKAPSDAELYPLYAELEFKTLLAKLKPPVDGLPLFAGDKKLEGAYRSYVASVDPPEFARLAEEIRALGAAERVAIAIAETDVGLSGSPGSGLSFGAAALAHDVVRDALRDLLRDAKRVAAYDAKRVYHALRSHGIEQRRFDDDAMIAAHVVNPARTFAQIDTGAPAPRGRPGSSRAAHACRAPGLPCHRPTDGRRTGGPRPGHRAAHDDQHGRMPPPERSCGRDRNEPPDGDLR